MIHCWQEYVCSLCFSQQWSGLLFPNQEALFFFPCNKSFYSLGKTFYCQIKPRSSQSCTPCLVLGVFWEDYMQNKMPLKSGKGSSSRQFTVVTLQALISASESLIFLQKLRWTDFYILFFSWNRAEVADAAFVVAWQGRGGWLLLSVLAESLFVIIEKAGKFP